MSQVCDITGKKPLVGNNVAHSNRKTKRRFMPNLHVKRFWVPSQKRYVKLRVSHKGLRLIDKYGIEEILKQIDN